MKHDPTNTNCDRVQYPDSDDVLCTCGVDEPPEPSVSVDAPASRKKPHVSMPPNVAALYDEFRAAALSLDSARKQLQPAQERFNRALNAFTEASIAS